MASSDAARHELYNALIGLMGPDPAETLMAHLLPDPSALHTLRMEMNERFDRIDERFEGIDARFDRMLIAQIGGFTALVAAVFLT